jgi:hypothetical protein
MRQMHAVMDHHNVCSLLFMNRWINEIDTMRAIENSVPVELVVCINMLLEQPVFAV